MRSRHSVIPIFIVPLMLFSCSQVKTVEQIFLESDDVVSTKSNPDGSDAFKAYLNSLETSAKSGSANKFQEDIESIISEGKVTEERLGTASLILRNYIVKRYGDSIIQDLQTMIGFRTHAEEGKDNWDAPEFLRQREWLESKAVKLGLDFKSYDGRMDELSVHGPEPILALLTHGDVVQVEEEKWTTHPWDSKIIDGKVYGRGSGDDKGGVIVSLYVLKALKDTGWEFTHTLNLVIANGEESSWEEIAYYKERAPLPDITIGIDAQYPVTNAQKAFRLLTVSSEEFDMSGKKGDWTITSMSGGIANNIIPENVEANLTSGANAFEDLNKLAQMWEKEHPPAKFVLTEEGNEIKIKAFGVTGHSAKPEKGHNAFGDLTAFLASLELKPDRWGSLTYFLGKYVGDEFYGRALGIAYNDSAMGPLTTNLATVKVTDGSPTTKISLRIPAGIDLSFIDEKVAMTIKDINSEYGSNLVLLINDYGPAHIVPEDTKLVRTLLEVWEEVTGTPGHTVSISGGTQSRMFPDGVDFGMSKSLEHSGAHGHDEYISVKDLMEAAELTVSAVLRLTTTD